MHKFEGQPDELPQGTTLLHGQYQIERFLGRGGFGITYLARDSLDRQVVIKECFPTELCFRIAGKVQSRSLNNNQQYSSVVRHFVREARRLAKLKHHNIVGVHQVFEENNTAYMALDQIDGTDLQSILENEPDRLTSQLIQQALRTALKAIGYIHRQSILHRDISPDNFLLDSEDNLTLIDFGAAREYADRAIGALSSMIAVKDGYSPHEFYLSDVEQDRSSDIYSLGATFYHLITGSAPPDSQERLAALAANADDPYQPLLGSTASYSDSFLTSVDKALSVLQKNRIQSAEEWIDMLDLQPVQPVAMPEAERSPDLQNRIALLVQDVNSDLEMKQNQAKAEKSSGSREKTEALLTEEVQQVDIFGNRIDDVDAWMSEQEKMLVVQRKTRNRSKSESELETKPSGSIISRLISGYFSQRQHKSPMAYQN